MSNFHLTFRCFFSVAFFVAVNALSVSGQTYRQYVKHGDEAFESGDFATALAHYEQAISIDSSRADLSYKYAECLRLNNYYQKAASFYQKVYDRDRGKIYPEGPFWLAVMLKHCGEYKAALKLWKKVARSVQREKKGYVYQKAQQEIQSCIYAQSLIKKKALIQVERLDENINSVHAEFATHFTPDSILYFSSLRPGNVNEEKISIYKTLNWTDSLVEVALLDTLVNASGFHNANASLSKDGQKLFFSRCDVKSRCSIWRAKKQNQNWVDIQALGKPVNFEMSSNTQPFYAELGHQNVLFFASDRKGGKGKLDIWYAIEQPDGSFAQVTNAGSLVNSLDNEITPYFNAADSLLYFSSTWHLGLGGYDIFKSKGLPGEDFEAPENLGIPINSSVNDFYFFSAPHSRFDFFTSNRSADQSNSEETCCNDIYRIEKKIKQDTTPDNPIETLNLFLPISLYFHNDEPNPRSQDTTTTFNYKETYDSYWEKRADYEAEFARGLKGQDKKNAQTEISDFFEDELQQGFNELEVFCPLLLQKLKSGEEIELHIKGFASPLANSDYNVLLTKRRINSLINYFKTYQEGAFLPFLNTTTNGSGKLRFKRIPFGEEKAATSVSDALEDQRNSIYSPGAARERKIEILSAQPFVVELPMFFEQTNFDFGSLLEGEIVRHSFTYKNTSKKELIIERISSDCGCTVPEQSQENTAPGKTGEIIVKFNSRGKMGKQVKNIQVFTNLQAAPFVLTIEANVVADRHDQHKDN